MKFVYALLTVFLLQTSLLAQNGDREGERQPPPDPSIDVPPAPVLTPQEALKSFELEDGFVIELVASEPLIHDPVEIEFDANGNLWAVEMRGYMPNPEGEGEDEPNGRVVVLKDLDGDGAMDKSTVFLDGLVMPRAIGLVRGGVLVAEPPRLWFCRDTNGDDVCDEKIQIADDYGNQKNPEHNANGLFWAMDNWIYSANHTTRFRNVQGHWERDDTIFRGQWGLTQDNFGRLFYNTNSDQLRVDLLPSEYLDRNPNYPGAKGANERIAPDQRVWPSRVTTGINRGYREGMLDDGKLTRFTAACGPVIYRGGLFPSEYAGNAFVPEPSGNLIKRNILEEANGIVAAKNAYEGREFLTSTDERFRPVNMNNGPDGALYVVDFYRGIIQHRIYMTSFLREQVEERGLDKPVGLGRIYRVYHQSNPPKPAPPLANRTSDELIQELSSENGWRRQTAQRLLVERGASEAVPQLKALAVESGSALARLHALRTLDGLGQLDLEILGRALNDPHPKVQVGAIRLCERFFHSDRLWKARELLTQRSESATLEVMRQLVLTMGGMNYETAKPVFLKTIPLLSDAFMREALMSGLGGNELDFLNELSGIARETFSEGAQRLAQSLAKSVFASREAVSVTELIELLDAESNGESKFQDAVVDGILSTVPRARRGRTPPKIKPVMLNERPKTIAALEEGSEKRTAILKLINWPESGTEEEKEEAVRPLTEEEQARFNLGQQLYAATCAACHQPHGNGQPGLAPPLRDSEWIDMSDERLIRIVLHGAQGPMTVKGETYQLAMPGLSVFNDEQVASLLTYVRRNWEHTGDPVPPETVKKVRAATADRIDMWTEEELLAIP